MNKKKLAVELEGKTVLITGASSGIGEHLAYMLADMNVHIILVARREEKLLAIKNDIEKKTARVSIFCADLRKAEDMEALL
ncbi:SDR family NAD(P)-dependent oxidoreductase [Acetivibrio cellulolyticus]